MDLLHPAMWHDHGIDLARWLHPAMWYVALESWQWIHQVAIPCFVIRGSEMTCHWTHPNVRHWNFTSGFDFDHITAVDMSFCTSLRNFIQIGPPSTEKITSCRFSRSQPSWIFRGPIIGSLKGPCATCYRSSIETIALNCSVFEKIAFLHFGVKIQDGGSPPDLRHLGLYGSNIRFFENPMCDFL